MEYLVPAFFLIALAINARAVFKLSLDWKGMRTTVRFVREAYARLSALPTEEALERKGATPVFLPLVPAYQEPDIAGTVTALVSSRYPHGHLHVVVITKEEEERAPHPLMGASTGELVRRLRETLPPYQQKRLIHVVMPGQGRKAQQLNWALRPAFELFFRRSQICLGHNQFVRLDALQAVGGFPTSGATEDSTLGYALGARGILIEAMPMVELTDLPETSEKVIRQNARWYLGVLDDIGFLRERWRERKSAFNFAQLTRHIGNKVIEWPIAALVYPFTGWLGWYLAYQYRAEHPVFFYFGVGAPTVSLALTVWVGGIVTQNSIEALRPYLPRAVDLQRKSWKEKFFVTFRCQTYWLLATRAASRLLWSLWRTGAYEAAKTDRVTSRLASVHLKRSA